MKKTSLMLVGALFAGGAALAQSGPPSGYKVLLALAKVHGVPASEESLRSLAPGSANFSKMRAALRLSAPVFAGLLRAGNSAASSVLATQAVLESASGKTLSDAFMAALADRDPSIFVNSGAKLNTLVSDPGLANKLTEVANNPVTPRGGGN